MTNWSQVELNCYWQSAVYEKDAVGIVPLKITSKGKDFLAIPLTEDGFERAVYERPTDGGPWEEVPLLGQDNPFS